jgi:hypothetical protein
VDHVCNAVAKLRPKVLVPECPRDPHSLCRGVVAKGHKMGAHFTNHSPFSIERHGQTVNGSSRATVYRWRVNLETGEAGIIGEKRRQLYAMDKRLDVKPIAQSLADAILTGKPDARIIINKDGSVRLKIGEIIPATYETNNVRPAEPASSPAFNDFGPLWLGRTESQRLPPAKKPKISAGGFN